MSGRWRGCVLAIFCVVCVVPTARPLVGQIIRGSVVDSATGQPVGAGFVVLLDEQGREVARTLTSPSGAFEIRSPREGAFRIRSERIGYRPWESEAIRLALRQTVEYSARVTALPVQLATIEARGETECRVRDEQGRAVSLLWDEARKALAAASWNAEQRAYRQTLLSYERDLDARRRRVINETTRFSSGLYEVPFRSIDPEILAEQGYVTEDDQGYVWYYAPDANVLLDEKFQALHCFRVVEGTGEHAGLIGLGFEPIRSLRQADVRGTLWIDRASAELRELEYSYTRLPNGVADDRIGGLVEFLPMPSGAWIVHRWQISTPLVVRERGRVAVDGFRDTGGEILVVTTLEGDSVYSAPMAHIDGNVADSSVGDFPVPLRGAVVSLVGTSFSALTGSDGRFKVDAPLSGTYGVSFTHPRLDSLGIPSPEAQVKIEPGTTATVDLALPSMTSVIDHHCDNQFVRGQRVVVGVVRDRIAEPVANAVVEADWQVVPILNEELVSVRTDRRVTNSDDEGRFVLCNVPEGPVITLQGRGERGGEDLEGSVRFSFEPGADQVAVKRSGDLVDRVYAPYVIWKVDLSLFAN